jgi:hypothetical protein
MYRVYTRKHKHARNQVERPARLVPNLFSGRQHEVTFCSDCVNKKVLLAPIVDWAELQTRIAATYVEVDD